MLDPQEFLFDRNTNKKNNSSARDCVLLVIDIYQIELIYKAQ